MQHHLIIFNLWSTLIKPLIWISAESNSIKLHHGQPHRTFNHPSHRHWLCCMLHNLHQHTVLFFNSQICAVLGGRHYKREAAQGVNQSCSCKQRESKWRLHLEGLKLNASHFRATEFNHITTYAIKTKLNPSVFVFPCLSKRRDFRLPISMHLMPLRKKALSALWSPLPMILPPLSITLVQSVLYPLCQ